MGVGRDRTARETREEGSVDGALPPGKAKRRDSTAKKPLLD